MADLKVTSFRIEEKDIEKFKAFMEEQGIGTQADGFKSIIQTVEMVQAKNLLKDREKEIGLFQDTVDRLVRYYLSSLEVNNHTKELLREELSKEIDTKNTVIVNLQEQLKEAKEELEKVAVLANYREELEKQHYKALGIEVIEE